MMREKYAMKTIGALITLSWLCMAGTAFADGGDVCIVADAKKTFAQMSPQEKNQISHRGKVFAELKEEFDKVLIWIRQKL